MKKESILKLVGIGILFLLAGYGISQILTPNCRIALIEIEDGGGPIYDIKDNFCWRLKNDCETKYENGMWFETDQSCLVRVVVKNATQSDQDS